jgi:hypothetical protein
METSTSPKTTLTDICGNIQAGDIVRLPGMTSFRKVFEVTGATPNISRRVPVTVNLVNRIETVYNTTACEFLIERAA